MTMRKKLIAKVWECGYPDFPLDPGDTEEMGADWADRIIDAILTTLAEHVAEDDELCMKGRAVLPELDEPLLEDAAACFAAMINHVRSGN